MADKDKSLEEWLAEERARLAGGSDAFVDQVRQMPVSAAPSGAGGGVDQILAGLGLGGAAIAGAVQKHPNPVTFEGVPVAIVVEALQNELTVSNKVEVVTGQMVSGTQPVTFQQNQKGTNGGPGKWVTAAVVTLIETEEVLTATVSDLSDESVRSTLASAGETILRQGANILQQFGHRIPGLTDLISGLGDVPILNRIPGLSGIQVPGLRAGMELITMLKDGVFELAEDIQDLGLVRRIWGVIDRVGGASEIAYLEEQGRIEEANRKRQEAERAWTHCGHCGRAYSEEESTRVTCASCGGERGTKPAWL